MKDLHIDYFFRNDSLLKQALTHCSASSDENNERLEFLGDAVLELCVSRYLFLKYPHMAEGDMAKTRAAAVCKDSLAEAAKRIGLDRFIILGKGEELTGGRQKPGIMADALEALLGAIYLDGGIRKALGIVKQLLASKIHEVVASGGVWDYKSHIQELLQANGKTNITYNVISQTGPEHDRMFTIELKNNNRVIGHGVGNSKKNAEQHAAKDALDKMQK